MRLAFHSDIVGVSYVFSFEKACLCDSRSHVCTKIILSFLRFDSTDLLAVWNIAENKNDLESGFSMKNCFNCKRIIYLILWNEMYK